jgi:hypothetical protein
MSRIADAGFASDLHKAFQDLVSLEHSLRAANIASTAKTRVNLPEAFTVFSLCQFAEPAIVFNA